MIIRILLLLMTILPFGVGAQTVVDIVVNSDNHNTLETAVIEAELVDALSGDGPFTLFAPTDAAFDLLPEGQLEALLLDPTGLLADILTYHVVSGTAAMSTDLSNGQEIETLFGKDITISVNDNGVFINGVQVSMANIEADNGIVHVIDAVLLPPAATIVDIVVASPDHNTLETAVIEADLAGTLSGDGPFTLFAPTDAAFDLLPDGKLQELLDDPTGELTDILLNHAVGAKAFDVDLSNDQEITTLFGDDVKVTINTDGVFINDSKVTVTNILAENGIVHVIDQILLPKVSNTIVDVVVNSDVHNTLETAVIAAELVGALSGDGPFTLFAPTDAAFDLLPEGQLEALLLDPTGLLADILTYHVVSGTSAMSTDLSNGQEIETLFGKDITVSVNDNGVFINGVQVSVANIEADNGIVHVIDAVLLPPVATIVDIVVASPDHNTLETAVIEADLAGTLSGDGPFTLFAPTDAAFDLLPDGKLQELLDDPTGELTDILLNHVVGAKAFDVDLSNDQEITTLFGDDVKVTINTDGVFINDSKVTVTNILAENGIVHVIDQILLPKVSNTIVDVVVNSDVHNTLETAVIAAELAGALSGDGPFTLFAPTDAAFDLLPDGQLEALLLDPTGLLADILTYHVVSGTAAMSTDLSNGQEIETLFGKDITVSVNDNGVFINGVQVSVANIEADNGIVHVIDAVLLPPVATIVDIVVASPDHNTLETAVIEAGLVEALSGDGPFTLFAPTDAAFDLLPDGKLQELLDDPSGELTDILQYHVAAAKAFSSDLNDGQEISTLLGKDVLVTINGDGVFINESKVTVTDIVAENGVVHVIDMILLPESNTIVDIVVNSDDHTILEDLVGLAELAETLQGDGPFTLFAPTDDAFNLVPQAILDELTDDPTGKLRDVLLYHAASGATFSGDLSDGQNIPTVLGQDVTVSIDGGNVFINNAQVTVADIEADNGVVHVINAVLVPEAVLKTGFIELEDVEVSPNPTTGILNIQLDEGSNEQVNINMMNQLGQVVANFQSNRSDISVDISHLPSGSYYVQIIQADKQGIVSVVKK